MLSGQHRLEATKLHREKLEGMGQELPEWTLKARCQVTRDNMSKEELQKLSGRLQAASKAVIPLTFETTMKRFLDDAQAFKRANPNKEINFAELLRVTYLKSGKSLLVDGEPVCMSSYPHQCIVHMCLCSCWANGSGCILNSTCCHASLL